MAVCLQKFIIRTPHNHIEAGLPKQCKVFQKKLSYLIVKPTELVLHLEVGGVKDHKGHISSKKFPYKIYPEANSILYICSDV